MQLDELYQEVILDHFKRPRCHGCLENHSAQTSLYNPLCGDQVELTIGVKDGRIVEIGFSGHGCSISQASASMMSEACKGKLVTEVESVVGKFRSMMRGEKPSADVAEIGDAVALEGVRKYSARVKCAMLAWEALEKCVDQACKDVPV